MPSVKSNAQQHLSPYAKAGERMSLYEKTVEILELKKRLLEVEKVGAELCQAKKDYDALNEKFRITSIGLRTTSEELKEAHDDLLDVGADVISLESALKKTGEQLAELRAKLNQSTADVTTSKDEHDQVKTDLQAAKKQLEDTTLELKQANADLSKARTSLEASILALKDERASTSKVNKECQHVNDQLLQVIAEHKKLTAKCKELEDEAKQNEADFEESMGSAMAENADAKKEIKQLKSDAMEQNGELNNEITQLKSNIEWSFNKIYLWKSWTVYLYHVCFNMYGGPMFIHNILPLAVEGEPRPINLWGVMEPSQQMYVELHGRLWDMQVQWLSLCNLTGGNLPAADMSNSTPLAQGSDGGSSELPPAADESIAPAPSYDAPKPQPAHTDLTSPPIHADGTGHDGDPSASTAIVPPTTPSLPHHGASSISPDPQLVSGVTPGHVPLHHSFADLLAQVSPGSSAFDSPVQAINVTRSHKQVRFDDPVASFKSDRKPATTAGQKSDTASEGGPPQPGVTRTTAAHLQPSSPPVHTPGPSLINQESVNAVTNKQTAGISLSKPAVPGRKTAKAARTGGRTPRARVPSLYDDAFDSLKLDDIKPFAETPPATAAPLQATPGPLHDTAPAQYLKAAVGDVPDTKDIEAGHTLLDILQVGKNDESSYAYSPMTSAAEPGVLPRPVPVLPPGVYDAEHDTPESPVVGPIDAPMTQDTSQNIPPQTDWSSTWGNPAYQDILMGDIEDNCGVSDDSSCPDAKEPATGTTSAADTLTQQPSALQCPEDTAWSGEGVISPKSPPPVSPVDAPTSKPADLPVIQPLNQPPNSFSITTEGVDNLIDIEFARVAAQIERGEEPRFGSDDDEGDCIMGGDDQNTSRPQTSDVPTTMDGVTGPTALAPVKTPTDFDSPLSGGDQTVDDVPASDPSLPAKGPTEMDTCPPDLPDNDDDLIEFFAKLDLSKQPSKPAPTAPTAPDGYAPAVPLLPFEPAPSRSDWANDKDFADIDIGDFIHVDDDDIDAIANDVNRSDHPLNDSTCGTDDGPQPAILDPPDPSRSPVTGNGPYWLQPPQPQIEPADQGSGSDGSGDIDPTSLDKVPTPVSNYAAPKQDGPSDGSGGAPDIIPIDPAMLDPPKAAKGPVPSWFMDMIG